MKVSTLLAAAAAIAVPALAPVERGAATGITRAQVQTRVERMFALTDANRDGFVTAAKAEARIASRRESCRNRGADGG